MTGSDLTGKKNYTGLIVVIAALTLALVLGIKFLVGGDGAQAPEQAPGGEALFRDNGSTQAPGYNPAARSEAAGGGGGLDMFSKTNAGYYGEDTSTPTAGAQAQPAGTATSVPAATAAAVKTVKTAPQGTVIPRMQASKAFGTAVPTNIAPTGAGQSMPDISALMKQAEGQARQQVKQQNSGN
jgi:hypothetical protein